MESSPVDREVTGVILKLEYPKPSPILSDPCDCPQTMPSHFGSVDLSLLSLLPLGSEHPLHGAFHLPPTQPQQQLQEMLATSQALLSFQVSGSNSRGLIYISWGLLEMRVSPRDIFDTHPENS